MIWFCDFSMRFSVYIVWHFVLTLNNLKLLQNISDKNIFIQENFMLLILG